MTDSVGRSVRAQDGRERVTGSIKFAIDHEVAGMLHARVLRSMAAHAALTRVDASAAERLPGVVGVLTRADLYKPGIRSHYGPVIPDRPLVADDRIRYAGEPVAVAIATNAEVAARAVDLIETDWELLPAFTDPESAIAEEAIDIHPDRHARDFVTYPDIPLAAGSKNVVNHFRIRRGDVEAGFAQADHVFEHTYRTPAQQHVSLEPHVAIAQIENGSATVWSSSSSPFTARFQVAETLGFPESRVRIVTWYVGGAFGGKTYPRIEPLAAACSWKVGGRPVRLEFSRAEEFQTITRHASVVTIRTGVLADGTIVARRVRILWGAGAYADISPRLAKNAGYASIGPYRVDDVAVDSFAVYTNVTPAGGFRGYGVPQVTWAYESQMDEMAAILGIDPLEMRQRNLVREGDAFSTGQPMSDVRYPELVGRAAELIVWDGPGGGNARGGPLRGKGLAVTVKGTVTPSTSTAIVRLNEDGSVDLLTGTTEVGQGSRTSLAQIAADAVRVEYGQVSIAYPDTAISPWDQTTSSSRSTMSMGGAIRKAGTDVREQLLRIAAELLEVDPADLQIEQGQVRVKGLPDRRLTFGEVVRRSRSGNLLGTGAHLTEGGLDPETGQGIATSAFHQAACAVEVEVDPETG